MPRLPIDYSNTVIYKILCNDLSITGCYVGHTTDFVRRKQRHKYYCTNESDNKKSSLKVYKTIRDNGGWDNYSMIEIEKYPCKDANEACAKEREWFERLDSNLNMVYPQRGDKEYRKDNKDELEKKRKQYYDEHKEEVRQYNELHKDEINLQRRQHYEEHKEEILIRERIRGRKMFICGCGKQSSCNYKKTFFHKQYMERVMLASDLSTPFGTNELN